MSECSRCGWQQDGTPTSYVTHCPICHFGIAQERAASLYRAANACADRDLKTAIELRQLAGRIERGEA